MKKKFLFSFLLLALGLTLVFLPNINFHRIEKRTTENTILAEEIPSHKLKANLKTEADFDYDSILEIDPTKILFDSQQADENLIIGRLLIPSIDLNLSIYKGVSNSILNSGLGTMKENIEMGKGNFPIVGHYSSDKDVLFARLYDIKSGDLIYLTDNDKIYEYKTYDAQVVKAEEIKWIDDEIADKHGKPIVSLMNCYYRDGENTGKRYFVFAELINEYDYSKTYDYKNK